MIGADHPSYCKPMHIDGLHGIEVGCPFRSEGDMKARDFVAQPVKLSYDAKWEEASRTHGQIGNRCDH